MTVSLAKAKNGLAALGFTLLALAFRLWNVGSPKGFIFDELYYANNAHSLIKHGVELHGDGQPEFIVHPPVGKWLIGLGIKLFGFNEFGWRFASAVVGSLAVGLIYLAAKELFNNYFLSCTAAILTILDGIHLVLSRTALLDIFLMFFILLAFYLILISKPWLASLSIGLALATKWSGIYYIVAFGAFLLYSDYRQEKALETEHPIREVAIRKLWKRFIQFAVIPIATYIASWAGWFITSTGWDRSWSGSAVKSFIHFHAEMWNFHTHLTTSHPYAANPWNWLFMGRPTSFFYATPKGCGTSSCSQEIFALGTPILWWTGLIALFITFGYWVARREWQSGLILLSLAAGYAPWFLIQKRTMFTFYAIVFEPFLILLIVFAISKFLESGESEELEESEESEEENVVRPWRLYVVYGYIVLVAVNFWYFLPLYIGNIISYSSWFHHMWLPSWI